MRDKPSVSIVLPSLKPDKKLDRCLKSIFAAFDDDCVVFEILIVTPSPDLYCYVYDNVSIIKETGPSIYNAMNDGLALAKYDYLYFIGQDDVLLPCFAKVLYDYCYDFDVIVTDVFYGANKVYRNSISKYFLSCRNWCHQGVIYRKSTFKDCVGLYNLDYKSQADHYVNIRLLGYGVSMKKVDVCISWYSADGFSSEYVDTNFRNDFIRIIEENFGIFFFYFVRLRRLLSLLRGSNYA